MIQNLSFNYFATKSWVYYLRLPLFIWVKAHKLTFLSDGNGMHPLPHFWACKIWRWPNIMSYLELQSIVTCQHGFEKHTSEVCIQPFHYQMAQAACLYLFNILYLSVKHLSKFLDLPPVVVSNTPRPPMSREQFEYLHMERNVVPHNETYSAELQPANFAMG